MRQRSRRDLVVDSVGEAIVRISLLPEVWYDAIRIVGSFKAGLRPQLVGRRGGS